MWKKIIIYFDKFEDRVRGRLSKTPIIYALIGGAAIVLFWRGIWVTGDELSSFLPERYIWLDGPLSVLVSVVILLATGLLVSFFVTDNIILSGIKQEKKLVEKAEAEMALEEKEIEKVEKKIEHIETELGDIEKKL